MSAALARAVESRERAADKEDRTEEIAALRALLRAADGARLRQEGEARAAELSARRERAASALSAEAQSRAERSEGRRRAAEAAKEGALDERVARLQARPGRFASFGLSDLSALLALCAWFA